jgi:hypothetical protein
MRAYEQEEQTRRGKSEAHTSAFSSLCSHSAQLRRHHQSDQRRRNRVQAVLALKRRGHHASAQNHASAGLLGRHPLISELLSVVIWGPTEHCEQTVPAYLVKFDFYTQPTCHRYRRRATVELFIQPFSSISAPKSR